MVAPVIPPSLTKADLDRLAKLGCGRTDCSHDHNGLIFIHGRCHETADVEASYEVGSGILTISCSACHRTVTRIQVAL